MTEPAADGAEQQRADLSIRISAIATLLATERARKKLSMRAAATEIGISFSSVARAERGNVPDTAVFLAIVNWLRLPLGWFMGAAGVEAPQDAYRRGWDDCAASVRTTLDALGGQP